MKLVEVKLTNYRGYGAETSFALEPLTVLVGRNDAGKSSMLEALDVFFNDAAIDGDDLCRWAASDRMRIACVFDDLPAAVVVDNQHPTSLESEHLLRRDGRLEVVKTYSCTSAGKVKLHSITAVADHPTASGLDDLLSLKISDLRARCKANGTDLGGANAAIKSHIRKALWAQQPELAKQEREIDLSKEDAKELAEQIALHFPVYALFRADRPSTDQDAEAQDPMKLAIKEVMKSRASELNNIVADIEAQLRVVADRTVAKIAEMSPGLAGELNPTVKNKNWDSLFSVSLTADDQIPLNKRGSGTRRLVLLNFFRARADERAGDAAHAIYAVEEPETSQHPDHQKMLLGAFQDMVDSGRVQVLLTTHTPNLARRVDRRCLRFIVSEQRTRTVRLGTDDGVADAIVRTLGLLTNHDVRAFVGVEGPNDESILCRISQVLAQTEHDIDDLAAAQAAGALIFLPLGGSNLEAWDARVRRLGIPEFYITDRDVAPPARAKYQDQVDRWIAGGQTAWITGKRELENYLHADCIRASFPDFAGTCADSFEDVPESCAKSRHQSPPALRTWNELDPKDRSRKSSDAKKILNRACAEAMTAELLTATDPQDEVRTWLRAITAALRTN